MDPVTGNVVVDLSALWGWLVGGGVSASAAGAGGYYLVQRIRNGKRGRMPSSACPLNGSLEAMNRAAQGIETMNINLGNFTSQIEMHYETIRRTNETVVRHLETQGAHLVEVVTALKYQRRE